MAQVDTNQLKASLQHLARLSVDVAGDSFDTAATSETTYVWFGDTLDVVPQDLALRALVPRRDKCEELLTYRWRFAVLP